MVNNGGNNGGWGLLDKTWKDGNDRGNDKMVNELGELKNATDNVNTSPSQSPHPRDPRPDLAADHVLWDRLLAVTYRHFPDTTGSLYPALHYMRCLGTGLAKTEEREIALPQCLDGTKKLKVGLKLFPHIGADGWQNQAEYDREKARVLSPLMVQLIAVLAETSRIIKAKNQAA